MFHSCFNGSSLEGKFQKAFDSCNVDDLDHWEYNILHSKAADECDVDVLTEVFRKQAQDGICITSVLDWLNKDNTLNDAAMQADIATLPKEIIDGVQTLECVIAHRAELENLLDASSCEFTISTRKTLQDFNDRIADYKCTLEAFGKSCLMYSGFNFNSLESGFVNSEENVEKEIDPENVSFDESS